MVRLHGQIFEHRAALLAASAVAVVAVAGCSSAGSIASQTTATVTVTATSKTSSPTSESMTTSKTAPPRSSRRTSRSSAASHEATPPAEPTTSNVTSTSQPPPAAAQSSPPAAPTTAEPPTFRSDFDKAWAKKTAGWIIDDITTIDGRIPSGRDIGLAYSNLSNSYGYLEEAGVPPGADAASYSARLSTAKDFASDAFDLEPADYLGALAKYLVVRGNTQLILDAVNAAVGTHRSLPPAPAT